MDANELTMWIDARYAALQRLLELSQLQVTAIEQGRMSELMQILSNKQQPLQELHQISLALREAIDDDPQRRQWPSPQDRIDCQQRQQQCEDMHLELLAIEAQCEATLETSRHSIQQELARIDSGRHAASTYAQANTTSGRGEQLDLSSF